MMMRGQQKQRGRERRMCTLTRATIGENHKVDTADAAVNPNAWERKSVPPPPHPTRYA